MNGCASAVLLFLIGTTTVAMADSFVYAVVKGMDRKTLTYKIHGGVGRGATYEEAKAEAMAKCETLTLTGGCEVVIAIEDGECARVGQACGRLKDFTESDSPCDFYASKTSSAKQIEANARKDNRTDVTVKEYCTKKETEAGGAERLQGSFGAYHGVKTKESPWGIK